MFENRKTEVQGVHYSRYIMSWLNAGGQVYDFGDEQFEKWLKSNEVTDEEIQHIKEMCCCAGKLELEMSAKSYIRAQRADNRKLREELREEKLRQKAEAKPMTVLAKKVKATVPALSKALKEVGWF